MQDKILLAHGSGGRLSHELVNQLLVARLGNAWLNRMDDSAILDCTGKLAFSTDSYVVSPRFFPGGDIGRLAVCGTVNDLSMMGAKPLFLSLAFILEEGLPMSDFEAIIESIHEAANQAEIKIVTGDTKVVEHGKADGIFINTAGIGVIAPGVNISGNNAASGDAIILSGTIADHGVTIMSQREGLKFTGELLSDCAPLNGLVADMISVCPSLHVLRDPTRGGLATTLNEIAGQSKAGIRITESNIPIRPSVKSLCELLGLDPLFVANEGKLLAVLPEEYAARLVAVMRLHPYGADAAIIGSIVSDHPGRVVLHTDFGTSRIIPMMSGDLLPRIC